MPSAAIDTSASGDTTVIAAPGAGKFLRVHGYDLAPAGTVSVKWKDTAGASYSGVMPTVVGAGPNEAFAHDGLFDLAANTGLVLNLSGAVQVGGTVDYSVRG